MLGKQNIHFVLLTKKLLKLFSGAIYGATDLLNMNGCTKETYFKDNRLPDWTIITDGVRAP